MKDFEKALIQHNNIRWINQKVLEGGDQTISDLELDEYVRMSSISYLETTNERGDRQFTPISNPGLVFIEQDLSFSPATCTPYALPPMPFKTVHETIAIECYSCKYHADSPYLKCAVNPARAIDQDCAEFERA
jgi:Family of unknown function (DUF6464)